MDENTTNPMAPGEPTDEKNSDTRKKIITILALIGIVAFIAIAIYVFMKRLEPEAAPRGPTLDTIAPIISPKLENIEEVEDLTAGKPLPPPIMPDDESNIIVNVIALLEHTRGNPNAKIVMIEYADLNSTYTRLVHDSLNQLLEANRDTLMWIYRHYPKSAKKSDYIAPQASECVFQQHGHNGFWEFLDLALKENTLTPEKLFTIAQQVNVDATEYENCMATDMTYGVVLKQKQQGSLREGVKVTPSFVFKNIETGEVRIVDGINTTSYMQAVIDSML